MKLFWVGSDTLFATRLIGGRKFPTKWTKYFYFLGMTVFAKIADLFVAEHYVVSKHLIENLKPLKLKKPFRVLIDPPQDMSHIKRVPHEGFNILYYRGLGGNMPFKNWVYGWDVYQKVVNEIGFTHHETDDGVGCMISRSDIKFMQVNGESNLEELYPEIDFYLRPNRSDGAPRMIMECEQIGIPYYWSKKNPNVNDILKQINEVIEANSKVQNIS